MRPLATLPLLAAGTMFTGLVFADDMKPHVSAMLRQNPATDIPNDFPDTANGRRIARAIQWSTYRREKLTAEERLRTHSSSTPPEDFVYNGFTQKWEVRKPPPPPISYPVFSFGDIRAF